MLRSNDATTTTTQFILSKYSSGVVSFKKRHHNVTVKQRMRENASGRANSKRQREIPQQFVVACALSCVPMRVHVYDQKKSARESISESLLTALSEAQPINPM